MKVLNVVGARPNFMKVAPLIREMRRQADLAPVLVHTGQHYDAEMSRVFFEELGLPKPDVDLGVGSGTHAAQTAHVMLRFEPVLEQIGPDLVVVVGDVNSTLACALVAAKRGVPVAHVEAGLRSFDDSMPEEINRRLTDSIATLLFTTSEDAVANLCREGIAPERIFFVGNVMIDTLLQLRNVAERSNILASLGVESGRYAVVTLHRPSNVDDGGVLAGVVDGLLEVGRRLPVVFPAHPRTLDRLKRFHLAERLTGDGVRVIGPLGYLDFLQLTAHARVVLTDSGGLQEETTVLGVPCLTLRHNTERSVTVTEGTNRLVGPDREAIATAIADVLEAGAKRGRIPKLWDGRASERIVSIIGERCGSST